jgi:ABC-type nitrate/sulfonate/bicarbonate transport system ATPase subunit
VTVDRVSISYRAVANRRLYRQLAARDVNLSVDAGEFVAIVGPSGCGKSTLLNAISGLVEVSSGSVAIDGVTDSTRLGRVAYMQQRDLLLPWRTVLANARLGLELAGADRQTANAAATERAERFGLQHVLHSYPWQLSGGMRQRVALLRASLQHSGVLLLDEPFGALDAITRMDLQQWLAGVLDRADRAVLLVTHDVDEAILLADRVYVMAVEHGVPGGTITARIDVPLPRPRVAEAVTTPEFVELKAELMAALSGTMTRSGTGRSHS